MAEEHRSVPALGLGSCGDRTRTGSVSGHGSAGAPPPCNAPADRFAGAFLLTRGNASAHSGDDSDGAIIRRLRARPPSLQGIETDNPYATFPLIRCYAENAAVLLWILDHPNDLSRLSSSADERFAIGRLISNAAKRAHGFKGIYEQLSEFSHPVAAGFHQPWRVVPDEERTLQWSSVPSFKTTEDKIWACFGLVELTEIHANVWPSAYRASVRSSPIT